MKSTDVTAYTAMHSFMPIIHHPSVIELKNNPNYKMDLNSSTDPGNFFKVIIIDNDFNTYQEVIDICMLALNIDYGEAYKIALAVDHNGEAQIAHAPYEEAEKIAGVIREIGIEVRVLPA